MWVLSLIAFSHRPACFWLRAATGPLGSRAWSFYACMGSTTPQGRCALASFRTPRLVLPASRTPSAPCIGDFGAQYPACIYPCPTLQVRPHDRPRMARGQSGLLCLSLYDSLIHYSTPVYPDAIPAGGPRHGPDYRPADSDSSLALAVTSEEAKAGVVLSEAERIHDAGSGETVRGGPLHGLGRGGGSRVLNHGRTVGVSRVIVRVDDVERLRLRVLHWPDGISVIQETCAGSPHGGWIIRIGECCR